MVVCRQNSHCFIKTSEFIVSYESSYGNQVRILMLWFNFITDVTPPPCFTRHCSHYCDGWPQLYDDVWSSCREVFSAYVYFFFISSFFLHRNDRFGVWVHLGVFKKNFWEQNLSKLSNLSLWVVTKRKSKINLEKWKNKKKNKIIDIRKWNLNFVHTSILYILMKKLSWYSIS